MNLKQISFLGPRVVFHPLSSKIKIVIYFNIVCETNQKRYLHEI